MLYILSVPLSTLGSLNIIRSLKALKALSALSAKATGGITVIRHEASGQTLTLSLADSVTPIEVLHDYSKALHPQLTPVQLSDHPAPRQPSSQTACKPAAGRLTVSAVHRVILS